MPAFRHPDRPVAEPFWLSSPPLSGTRRRRRPQASRRSNRPPAGAFGSAIHRRVSFYVYRSTYTVLRDKFKHFRAPVVHFPSRPRKNRATSRSFAHSTPGRGFARTRGVGGKGWGRKLGAASTI